MWVFNINTATRDAAPFFHRICVEATFPYYDKSLFGKQFMFSEQNSSNAEIFHFRTGTV